jgi:hypothetical protein
VTTLCKGGNQPAKATLFAFSYSFPTDDTTDFPSGQTSASGFFTATDQGGGQYLATAAWGTWNGQTITGLSPIGSEAANDNLLFPDASAVLDVSGVTFEVAGPILGDLGYGKVNVYFYAGSGYTDGGFDTGYSPTFTLSEVPEPATSGLLGAGLAAIRRSRKACFS